MLFSKNITGTVISFSGCRKYVLPMSQSLECRFISPEYRHELAHDDMGDYGEYFVCYHSIEIAYLLDGESHIIKFNNVSVPCHYKAGDSIELKYNKRNRTVCIKG